MPKNGQPGKIRTVQAGIFTNKNVLESKNCPGWIFTNKNIVSNLESFGDFFCYFYDFKVHFDVSITVCIESYTHARKDIRRVMSPYRGLRSPRYGLITRRVIWTSHLWHFAVVVSWSTLPLTRFLELSAHIMSLPARLLFKAVERYEKAADVQAW